jgi:hypothetical protein
MKVFIRKIGQQLYLDAQDGWATDIQKASDFRSGTEAVNHAVRLQLQDVELYCAFPNPEHDFSLSLSGDGRRRSHTPQRAT